MLPYALVETENEKSSSPLMSISPFGWAFSRHEGLLLTAFRKRSLLSMRPTASSAPKAQIFSPIFVVVGYDRAMPTAAHTSTEGLRLRRCLDPTCNTMFAICRCCDRGQRYCGDECRQRVRRLQVAAAGRRYQATDAGKQAHCQRQRSYRERSSAALVTHQGPSSVTCPTAPATKDLNQCFICGRVSRWHNPFDSVTLRRLRRGRPWCRPGAQISTFLHDR
jgi:hypothetical protein